MNKSCIALLLASSLLFPTIVLAGPNEDLAKGLAQGKSALVEQAILQGANPNQLLNIGNEQWTPLIWAANWGNLKLVKLFLEKGANPNAKNKEGWTPLLLAASGGYRDVVKLLLEKGANPKAKANRGSTVLMSAVVGRNLDVVKLLLDKGADPSVKNSEGKTALDIARESEAVLSTYADVVKYLEKLK